MGTPLKKVLQDFKGQKLRTIIVVVSVMVGVFCITGVSTMTAILTDAFTNAFARANAPDITVATLNTNANILPSIRRLPNVTGAESRILYTTRWRTTGAWFSLNVVGYDSFATTRIGKINLKSGHFPSAGEIMPDWTTKPVLDTKYGGQVQVQGPHGITRYPVLGYGSDPTAEPSYDTGISIAYMPRSAVEQLSGFTGSNEFVVKLTSFDKSDAAVAAIRSLLQSKHVPVLAVVAHDPNDIPSISAFRSISSILTIFGYVALVLSSMLIINTLTTVVSEQTPIIGTMKAVGASRGQILRTYLTLGFLYGACGTLVGLILGVIGGYGLVQGYSSLNGASTGGVIIAPSALLKGALVGIGITLVAAFFPVIRGSGITVREALASYGIGLGYKPSPVDRAVDAMGFLSRPTRISVRNAFRRPVRLMLTLAPLALAGGTFIGAGSTATALNTAVSAVSNVYRADFVVNLGQPSNINQVTGVMRKVRGVSDVEAWYNTPIKVNDQDALLSGVPASTSAYHIQLMSGRWVNNADRNGIVLGDSFAKKFGIKLGQTVTITTATQETVQWRVVGTVNDRSNDGHVGFSPLAQVQGTTRQPGKTNYLFISGTQHTSGAITGLINRSSDALFPLGVQPSFVKVSDLISQTKREFTVLSVLLYSMVALVAIVAALGLFASLTMNVVERRREIGVMRTIGASSKDVLQVFTVEGLVIGLLACVLAVIIGVPAGFAFGALITAVLIQLSVGFAPIYIVLMVVFMEVVAAVASIAPASSAAKLRIADVLRYG